MENDAPRTDRIEPEHFGQVPGDGLSLAVLIGSEPHHPGLAGSRLQFFYQFLLVGRNLIYRSEVAIDINTYATLLEVAYVTEARHHLVIRA